MNDTISHLKLETLIMFRLSSEPWFDIEGIIGDGDEKGKMGNRRGVWQYAL